MLRSGYGLFKTSERHLKKAPDPAQAGMYSTYPSPQEAINPRGCNLSPCAMTALGLKTVVL